MWQQCGRLEIDMDQILGRWIFGAAEGKFYSIALASSCCRRVREQQHTCPAGGNPGWELWDLEKREHAQSIESIGQMGGVYVFGIVSPLFSLRFKCFCPGLPLLCPSPPYARN